MSDNLYFLVILYQLYRLFEHLTLNFKNTAYFQMALDNFNDYRILYDGSLLFHMNDFFAVFIGAVPCTWRILNEIVAA